MQALSPIVPASVPCKCCDGTASVYGVVDFNKNCEAAKNSFPLPWAGIPVYYHRCTGCGLIFTIRFDDFSKDDFATHIYNDSYRLVDPDYVENRPVQNAKTLCSMFAKTPNITILDYGGGNGKLAAMLRAAGFADVITYDPFVPAFSTLPQRKFQLVIAYEVMEHTPTPIPTLQQIATLRAPDGIIHFSTMTQPANIDQIGLNWWYASPRNGHVTLYSMHALQKLGQRLQMRLASSGQGSHFFVDKPPDFARHLLGPA